MYVSEMLVNASGQRWIDHLGELLGGKSSQSPQTPELVKEFPRGLLADSWDLQ